MSTRVTTERDDRGAVVWLQVPWQLQREALWLFAVFTLTLALVQPTGMRWGAVVLAGALLALHAVVGPDHRGDRCGL